MGAYNDLIQVRNTLLGRFDRIEKKIDTILAYLRLMDANVTPPQPQTKQEGEQKHDN